jgi:glyoxylase-like metal-dependent hydrolase (beta-lactamase superfamily II)
VVYLPAEKILATGDLLDDLPYVGHGYPRSWRATLEEIAALPVEVFVPGHGTPYRDRGQLERVSAFVAALVDGVEAAVAKGTTREDLATGIDLTLHRTALAGDDPVAGRFFDGVLKEALERTYDDVTGALVD